MGGGVEKGCGPQAMQAGIFSAVAGGIVGSLQAAWTDRPMIADQTSAHIRFAAQNISRAAGVFGVAGALFVGGRCAAKDMRQTDDSLNAVLGGALAGAALGMGARSGSAAFSAVLMLGIVAGAVDYQSRLHSTQEARAVDIFRNLKKKAEQHE